ncbi:MAG: hypothetical protein HC858_02680 [Brachymonas sp.]|nr:hypothetical protein [Brachymonas sp.]
MNLSRAHKQAEPAALRVNHEDMPVVNFEGGHLRIVAGEFQGQSSSISSDPRWLTRVNMLDVTLEPGASVDIPVKAGDNAFFVIRSGTILNHFEAVAGKDIAQSAIIFEANNTLMQVARLQAGGEKLRGVFFSGTPINEPIYPGGPFMGNSAEDIMAYKRAFAAGQMGHLSKSF